MKNSNLFSTKKFKYGSSAVVFTAVFVVFVLLFNVVLSLVNNKVGGLYIDMTSKKLYGISEETEEIMAGIDKPVEIIFCRPSDIIEADDRANRVRLLAENYKSSFKNVDVIYKDVFSNPAYFNAFKKTSADIIYDSSIIVHCPSTGLSKIYNLDNMYKTASSTGMEFAFDGENKLTRAIVNCARTDENMLRAGFVVGHNESVNDALRHFLEDYGYEISTVDLKKTAGSDLAKYNLLIVCDPQSDYSGITGGSGNEIEKLRDYVSEDFGNIFFFLNATAIEMPELFELLDENFGVKVNNRAMIVESDENAIPNSYGLSFFGTYSADSTTDGYKIHKSVSTSDTGSLPVFAQACAMDITGTTNNKMTVSGIVETSKNAGAFEGENAYLWASKPVMTLTKYTDILGGVEKSASVFVCGSTGFLLGLEESSCSNGDLITNALSSINAESAINIEFKPLDESDITVTSAVSSGMMRRLAIVFPLIIAAIGAVVFIKRKYL